MRRTLTIVGVTVLATLLLQALAAAAFIYSGVYDISAVQPHSPLEFFVLDTTQRRSVRARAKGQPLPPLDDPASVRRGFSLYETNCLGCHGAPGVPRERMGVGVNPNPPYLERSLDVWSPVELRWIIANGIKMAGMPGFAHGVDEQGLIDLTAFVVRLSTLSPSEYQRMAQSVEGTLPPGEEVAWVSDDRAQWDELERRGDRGRGERLLGELGCGSCHVVPGVPQARGMVGAPLTRWGARHYIAGRLINQPAELVRFVRYPQDVKPGTAMPMLDVSEQDAWDIARYLFSLN